MGNEEVLKLTITSDRRIRIESKDITISKNYGDISIGKDSLEERTINTLIKWLEEKRLHTEEEFQLLGAHLYSALFQANEISRILDDFLCKRKLENKFLRIEFWFEEPENEIAKWPLEYLYRRDPQTDGHFLATEPNLAITRCLNVVGRPQRVESVARVFIVAASPYGEGIGMIPFENLLNEIETLQWVDPNDHTKGRRFEIVDKLFTNYKSEDEIQNNPNEKAKATWSEFQSKLEDLEVQKKTPHVIHFIGHGRCSGDRNKSGEAQLAFMADNYQADWINGKKLANSLTKYEDVKLVFLQACESAKAPDNIYAPYPAISVARHLAGKHIPAVVAMISKVKIKIADDFAKTFYSSLAQTMPVYRAVQEGRHKISDEDLKELGMPILYLLHSRDDIDFVFPGPVFHAVAPSHGREKLIDNLPPTDIEVYCAWCGEKQSRLSTSHPYCSYCQARIACPKCNKFVTKGPKLKEKENYHCCCVDFNKKGNIVAEYDINDDTASMPKRPPDFITPSKQVILTQASDIYQENRHRG
jgi:hypothetical protein